MINTLDKKWLKAAAIRAGKTAAQTAVSMLTVGQAFISIDWRNVLSVSITAAIISILTSIAGLPEVGDKFPEDWRKDEDRSGV